MEKVDAIETLGNKELGIEEVEKIYNEFKEDLEVVGQVAMNLSIRTSVYDRDQESSETMTRLLLSLAESSDMMTRWAVAKNPHTPAEILAKLGEDKINLVRALVATNVNTPLETLNKFAEDEKIVTDGLTGNPNTPTEILEKMSSSSDKMVRLRIAENPNTPKAVLEKLTLDNDPDVSKASEVHLAKRG
ncbi:hypothetical protein ThvES_00008930 [Thiovulum sp. ES]|nr:hypothetical protein ThvES_00008930 [Thiovulum sp. ES]